MLLLRSLGGMRIINLPYRADRRAEFSDQLRNIGADLTGTDMAFFPAIRPESSGDFPSVGARGCFLSHLAILREALESGAEKILICEDDLNFSRDFGKRIKQAMTELNAVNWSIFYGFHPKGLTASGGAVTEIPPSFEFECAHFVAFRRPAINALVQYLENMLLRPSGHRDGGPMHVDGAYNWFRSAYPEMRAFAATPSLGYQRSSSTDIADPSLADRIGILRPLVKYGRQIRNLIRA